MVHRNLKTRIGVTEQSRPCAAVPTRVFSSTTSHTTIMLPPFPIFCPVANFSPALMSTLVPVPWPRGVGIEHAQRQEKETESLAARVKPVVLCLGISNSPL